MGVFGGGRKNPKSATPAIGGGHCGTHRARRLGHAGDAPGLFKGIERLCRKNGVLLIADEVATGFGRTGGMFAVEQEGVRPDFLVRPKP